MKRAIPVLIIVLGIASLYPMQRHIDASTPMEVAGEDALYLTSGETIKKMSLGLDGLAADVYWIRTIQYFGRKLLDSGKPLSSRATKGVDMPLLAPLLNIVVTLDPQHLAAYRFGAIFLPERDLDAAIALLERGIRENPNEWRLYQDIAYIYWQQGKQLPEAEQAAFYEKAAEYYDQGSRLPGARWWMADMAGLMKIKGQDREVARAIYRSYSESDDEHIRSQADARMKQLDSLDQRDALNSMLAKYVERAGECPPDLRAIIKRLQGTNLSRDPLFSALSEKDRKVFLSIAINEDQTPVDPDGFPYVLDSSTCKVQLAANTTIAE